MSVNVKRWYSWLSWLAALVLALGFLWLLMMDWRSHQHDWHDWQDWQQRDQGQQLANLSRDLTHQSMLLAQVILRDQVFIDRVREAHGIYLQDLSQGTAERTAQQRQRLERYLASYWENVRGHGVIQLNVFFNPAAVGFLRMQRPQRYGDSLAGLRPQLTQVFATGMPVWGMDLSREGSGYSALVPIFADTEHQGSVIAVLEVTLDSLPDFYRDDSLNMAIFLRKSATEPLLWAETQRKLNSLSHITLNDWRLESYSRPMVMEWWNQSLIPIQYNLRALSASDGRMFLLSWWPLLQGEQGSGPVIAAAVWTDISQPYSDYLADGRRILAKWLLALLAAELLLITFIQLNRQRMRQLMAEHSAELQKEIAASEQSRQHLALALRSSDSGFWEWDIVHERASFSPEWRRLCGLPPDETGSFELDEWLGRVHPADKRASYSEMLRHIKGETPMYESEYRLRVADGSYKWILSRGKVVEWSANGSASLMLGVYSDITQRKNMELIAIRQQAALHALNEIASLPATESDELLTQALSLAVRYLGVGTGVVSEVNAGRYQVRICFSMRDEWLPADKELPLGQTYAGLVISARDVVAEDDIPGSVLADHPAYRHSADESYIGAPLWVQGQLYGTLCFSSRKSRQHEYDRLDKDFVRLLGRWVSSVVERWHQEREKKTILDRFQKLSQRVPGFLYQYQLRPDGSTFFPYASPGIYAVYGVHPQDVGEDAACMLDVLYPEDLDWIRESISWSALHLTPWVATVRVNHPERGLIWTHVQSVPERLPDGSVLWNGYVSDITPLKQTELELAQTNALNQAIFDAATVSIIATDVNGMIKTFNRGAEVLLGYNAVEMIDKRTPEIIHDPDEMAARTQQLKRELGQDIQAGFEVLVARARAGWDDESEWTYIRYDGSRIPVLLAISALRDLEGNIFGYLGIAQDISESKRVDKMKAEFISTVSHELRTPLTAISGALGILTAGGAGTLPEAATRMLQIAHNNALRLIHLVNDLLDMEKLVAGKMQFEIHMQSLLPIVRQSLETNASYAAQFHVHYVLDPDSDDAMVSVDSLRLEQVLANYLSNAAKFSPPNGQVWINIRRRMGSVRVTVTDHGRGIPEAFRARIFHKFSQADSSDSRQKGGTGLGLAICKELIERMGGKVGFDSAEGQGASFYFELPCEDSAQSLEHQGAESHPRVLILEDDTSVCQVWASLLSQADCWCDSTTRGAIALEYLAAHPYHLLILDLKLPDMDGADVIRWLDEREIREQLPALPILVVTASTDKTQLPGAGRDRPLRWLQKTASNQALLEAARELLFPAGSTGTTAPDTRSDNGGNLP